MKEISFGVEEPILQKVNAFNPCERFTSGGQVDLNGDWCGDYIYISKGDICKTFKKKGVRRGNWLCVHIVISI